MRSRDEIVDFLRESIEEVSLGRLSAEEIDPGARILEELGLDSLDYATVVLMSEDRLGTTIDEDGVDWSRIQTVDELATFLEGQR